MGAYFFPANEVFQAPDGRFVFSYSSKGIQSQNSIALCLTTAIRNNLHLHVQIADYIDQGLANYVLRTPTTVYLFRVLLEQSY